MLNEDPKTEGLHFIQNKPWLSLLLKGEFNFGGMPCLLKQGYKILVSEFILHIRNDNITKSISNYHQLMCCRQQIIQHTRTRNGDRKQQQSRQEEEEEGTRGY